MCNEKMFIVLQIVKIFPNHGQDLSMENLLRLLVFQEVFSVTISVM